MVVSAVAISAFGISASCGSSKTKENSTAKAQKIPLMPEIMGAEITKVLSSLNGKEKAVSSIAYQFYSDAKSPFQDSVNFYTGQFCWDLTAEQEDPYVYVPLSHSFFYKRLDELEANFKKYETESDHSFVWELKINSEIDVTLQDYVQLKQKGFFYFGGAHPNTIMTDRFIAKVDGRTLLLKDIVKDTKQFNQIAEKYFRIERDLKPTDELKTDFWFKDGLFECNDNFTISPKGITFTFNSYEVAPYSFGPTVFMVPMNEIQSLLKIDIRKV